jgi:hypothetical protein
MKDSLKTFLLISAASLAAGCGYSTKAYRYDDVALEPREANCPLELFTSLPPRRKSLRIGVVEFTAKALGRPPKTEEEARDHAYPYACAAGGNALLLVHDRHGRYLKATILKMVEPVSREKEARRQ